MPYLCIVHLKFIRMKNFFRFLLMSLFLATSFSAVSCSDDDDDPAGNNSIVGTWTWTGEDITLTAQFNPDKTGALIVATGGRNLTESFEYDYLPEERRMEIIGSTLEGVYEVTMTATQLRLRDSGGYWEFSRK